MCDCRECRERESLIRDLYAAERKLLRVYGGKFREANKSSRYREAQNRRMGAETLYARHLQSAHGLSERESFDRSRAVTENIS